MNTSKGFFDRIKHMLLKRYLVVFLNQINQEYEAYPTADHFVNLVVDRRWPRILYFFKTAKEFRKLIEVTLEDCIGSDPDKHFIDYHEDKDGTKSRESLAVTARGRKLISPFGFIQIVGGEYSVVWSLVIGVLTFFIGRYWDGIEEFLKSLF